MKTTRNWLSQMETRFFVYHHNRTYTHLPHAALKRQTLVCCCIVAHVAPQDHNWILICTGDTDVVVLAVMVAQTLPAKQEVWLAFGTGKSFRYLAAHKIAACLGAEKSRALPMFHALTRCDTLSAFVGHGKKVHGLSGIPCQS